MKTRAELRIYPSEEEGIPDLVEIVGGYWAEGYSIEESEENYVWAMGDYMEMMNWSLPEDWWEEEE